MSYIPTQGNSTLRSHNNTNFVFDQSSRQVHSSPPRRRHRYTQRPLDSLSTFASTFKVSRILSTSIRRRVNAKAKKDMERYAPFLAPLWLALSVARYSFAERRLTYRSCVNYPLSLEGWFAYLFWYVFKFGWEDGIGTHGIFSSA